MRQSHGVLLLVLTLLGFPSGEIFADVSLPAVLSSHMVLQREQTVPVWGWAEPGETIRVQFAGTTSQPQADPVGRWQVTLPKLATSVQPQTMSIQGANGWRAGRWGLFTDWIFRTPVLPTSR